MEHLEPTAVAVKYFGGQIRFYRERAGLTRSQLGDALGYSESTIIAFERGSRLPVEGVLKQLDEAVSAGGALAAGAAQLVRRPFAGFFAEFAELEPDALSLYSYNQMSIPGLLQTEEYARAVISAYCPPLSDKEIEEKVQGRMGRQSLLTRQPPPLLSFVIEESAIRRPLGGTAVLRDQLMHVLDCARKRHVSVQVMPSDCESHSGLDGPLILLRAGDGRELGYIEGQSTSTWVTDPSQLTALEQRHGIIRAQALTTRDSAELIEEVAKAL